VVLWGSDGKHLSLGIIGVLQVQESGTCSILTNNNTHDSALSWAFLYNTHAAMHVREIILN